MVSFLLNDPLESRYPPVPPERAPTASAIVVLGGSVTPLAPPRNWVNLHQTVDRIVHAARLYRAGRAPLVVATGGGGPQIDSPQKPADVMADLLVEWGVPREAIVLERRSRDTYQNLLYSKEILDARGIRDVLLVTSASHMPRAMALAEAMGLDAIPAGTDYHLGRIEFAGIYAWLPDAGALQSTSAALKEYAGILVYRLRGRIRALPSF